MGATSEALLAKKFWKMFIWVPYSQSRAFSANTGLEREIVYAELFEYAKHAENKLKAAFSLGNVTGNE